MKKFTQFGTEAPEPDPEATGRASFRLKSFGREQLRKRFWLAVLCAFLSVPLGATSVLASATALAGQSSDSVVSSSVNLLFLGKLVPEPAMTVEAHADRTAVLATSHMPRYPQNAFEKQREGWVIAEIDINIDGLVQNAHIVSNSSTSMFNQSALRALRKFTFVPASSGGMPALVRGRKYKITYRLAEG